MILDNYPPFDDSAWRLVKGVPQAHQQQRASNLVDDASEHHEDRHESHAHPWCTACHVRDGREDLTPLRTPSELNRWLKGIDGHEKIHQYAADAKKHLEAGFLNTLEDFCAHYGDRLSKPLCEYLHEYVEGEFSWNYWLGESIRDTNSRAMRYLTIHGRPPVDPWPNLPVVADLSEEFLTRDELRNLPTVEPLIENVIPRHSYGILSGRDGSYKTFVALDWACSLATGRPWFGRLSEPVKVLYIAAEGAYGIDKRLDAWEEEHGAKVEDDHFVVRPAGLNMHKPGAEFDRLLEHIREHSYGLIVVDTLRRVAGAADGNSSEMGVVVDNLARLKAETDRGTVLVIAHTGKDDRDTRGFSGIEDDADFVWHVQRDEMNLKLVNTKMKDGPDGASLNLAARSCLESLVLIESRAGDEVMVVSATQVRLMETLREIFPDGASGSQLLDASGLPKTTYYRDLSRLVGAGHIVKGGTPQRPFYTPIPQDRFPSDSHETVPSSLWPIPTPIPEIPTESQPDSHTESHGSHPPIGVGHRERDEEVS